MKVLLSLIKGLLRLIKGLSFKALLRSYSPWIAALPYPLLIQAMGDLSHNPKQRLKKNNGIFAVLAVCDHHVSSILAILGIWGPKGSFFEGSQKSLLFLAYPRLIQGLSFKPLSSPH